MSKEILIVEEILNKYKENHDYEGTLTYGAEKIREYKRISNENEQDTTTGDSCGVSCRTSRSLDGDRGIIEEAEKKLKEMLIINVDLIEKLKNNL